MTMLSEAAGSDVHDPSNLATFFAAKLAETRFPICPWMVI